MTEKVSKVPSADEQVDGDREKVQSAKAQRTVGTLRRTWHAAG